MTTTLTSKCCHAYVATQHSDEGTSYYWCIACKKACDPDYPDTPKPTEECCGPHKGSTWICDCPPDCPNCKITAEHIDFGIPKPTEDTEEWKEKIDKSVKENQFSIEEQEFVFTRLLLHYGQQCYADGYQRNGTMTDPHDAKKSLFSYISQLNLHREKQVKADLIERIKNLIENNETVGWKAAYHTGSEAGAGHVMGYKTACQDINQLLKEEL